MMELNINIDHVATLRNARGGNDPDLLRAAEIVLATDSAGIVIHLREDRRHIKDADVYAIRKICNKKLDLEMANAPEIVDIALNVMPDLITLVPEKREELTTEGGLNIQKYATELEKTINRMHAQNIKVSLFVEPEEATINLCHKIGADMVELHTGKYANLCPANQFANELSAIKSATAQAKSLGMRVAAGHGLNLENTKEIASITGIDEVSIGHSIIARAVFIGLQAAINEMLELIQRSKL